MKDNQQPSPMAYAKYVATVPGGAAGPHLARPSTDQGAALVQRRPARREPGPHRPDGPRAQERDVRPARRDGLQGDRGRLPLGLPARFRLRASHHRERPHPRGRHDPGAHAVSRGPHPAHLRIGASGRRAPSSTSTTRSRRCSDGSSSDWTRPASQKIATDAAALLSRPRIDVARRPSSSTSTRPRASPAPNSTTPWRSATR